MMLKGAIALKCRKKLLRIERLVENSRRSRPPADLSLQALLGYFIERSFTHHKKRNIRG
jgi:hypothetical protein